VLRYAIASLKLRQAAKCSFSARSSSSIDSNHRVIEFRVACSSLEFDRSPRLSMIFVIDGVCRVQRSDRTSSVTNPKPTTQLHRIELVSHHCSTVSRSGSWRCSPEAPGCRWGSCRARSPPAVYWNSSAAWLLSRSWDTGPSCSPCRNADRRRMAGSALASGVCRSARISAA